MWSNIYIWFVIITVKYEADFKRLMFVESALTEKCSLFLVFMYVFSVETVTISKKPTTAASMWTKSPTRLSEYPAVLYTERPRFVFITYTIIQNITSSEVRSAPWTVQLYVTQTQENKHKYRNEVKNKNKESNVQDLINNNKSRNVQTGCTGYIHRSYTDDGE